MQIGYIPSKGAAETYYTVVTNTLGDVSEIYDNNANLVGSYSYDPYGALLNIDKKNDPQNILEKNPFRYRGYYCDVETGWYYLNSRYYDPQVKRFINRDTAAVLATGFGNASQYNQYAYCFNNPVSYQDDEGDFPQFVAGALFGAGSEAIGEFISNKGDWRKINLQKVAIAGLCGGVSATIPFGGKVLSAGISAVQSIIFDAMDGEQDKRLFINELFSDRQLPGNIGNLASSIFGIGAGIVQGDIYNMLAKI